MSATAQRSTVAAVIAALREDERREEIAAEIVARLGQAPGYEDVAPRELAAEVALSLGAFLASLDPGPSVPYTELHRELWLDLGRARAEQGVPLENVLRGWRIGLDVIRGHVNRLTAELECPPQVAIQLLEQALAWHDAGMLSTAAGHHEAELESARHQRDYRLAFLRRALADGLSAEDLRAAAALSIDRGVSYHAVRARPRDEADAHRIQRQLRPGHSTDGRDGLIALIDGDVCGFLARLPSRCDTAVGVSAAMKLTEMPRAFLLATRAMEVGLAAGRSGFLRFDELGVLPAVQTDADVTATLAAHLTDPVEELGQSGTAILETVEAFIRNGLRLEATAEELFVHVNTVRYRINRFEELTGRSLRDGETIVGAWWAITHRRLRPPD